jgi:hypothetical protein
MMEIISWSEIVGKKGCAFCSDLDDEGPKNILELGGE